MSARVVPLVEATLPGAVSTPLFGMGGNEDNDPGSRAPASLRPDTRHQVVTNLETLLSTFDKDGDGIIDKDERKRLLAQFRGNVVVADVPDGNSETGEVLLKRTALNSLYETLNDRKERRRDYMKLMRSIGYLGLFVTILFLQRDPTTSFTIFETLSSIVPEGSANQPITFFAKSEVYKWLGCALNLSAPPDALFFPLWSDPVCGDGVCSFPVEYPAFGSFGCIADCGLSTVKTSVVTITVMASFRLNSQITQSLQESFVATTRWNLCFLSNYTNTETKLCWYEEPRIFATATETQQVILNLPDADWSIEVTAPYGSVTGFVQLGNATEAPDAPVLTSWSFCEARDVEPTPSGPSQTARRSARQVGEGFDEAVAAEKDGRSAPSRPSKGGLSFSVSSSEAAPADAEEAAEIIAAAEAAAALDGPRGKTRESLAFLEAKLRAGPVGASAVGREWPSTARRDGKAEKAADDSSVEAPAAVSAAAKQPAGVSAWDGAAWPDVSNLTYGGLAGARWVDPLHGAAAAALATNRSGSLKNSRRHLLGQLTTLVQFDLRGDGLGVAVDLTTAVIDPGTGTRINFQDTRRPLLSGGQLPTNFAPITYGPDDKTVDDLGNFIPTPGCQPGADFYVVVKVPPGAVAASLMAWSITSAAAGGKTVASSEVFTERTRFWGSLGSGYNPYPGGESWYVSRWCAPTAAAMASPMTITLATDPSAAMYVGAAQISGVSLVVISKDRCRLAPRWPLLFYAFPNPAMGTFSASVPSFQTTCDDYTPKELDLEDPYSSWSFAALSVLGAGGQAANMSGFIANRAVTEAPVNTAACAPGYGPIYFMEWFGKSSDSVSYMATLVQRSFPYFGIAGTDPLAVGLVPSLSSFDKTKRDGTNLPNPLAVQQFAKPQGTLRMFCAAHGVYQIKATQTVMPRRAGQLIFTNQQGCSLFASVDKLSLSGDSSEEGALGYFLVGSWGMPNGTAYATPAYGGSFTQCPVQVLDVAKTSRGWDGCGARNGTRVYMYWYGIGVYHSSDVSWRVESYTEAGSRLPTVMSGDGYLPTRNTLERWCMAPGKYRLNAYDNNVISSTNSSMGWDGGTLYVTHADGCIINEAYVDMSQEFAGADIHTSSVDFTVYREGGCLRNSPRTGGYVNLARNATDGGTCLGSLGVVYSCAGISRTAIGIDQFFTSASAQTTACRTFCSTSVCDFPSFIIYGPVLAANGCCDQEIGDYSKPFSLFQWRPSGTDYSLIPRLSLQAEAKTRNLVLNNRVIGGVLITQTRSGTGACDERFRHLQDECQLTRLSSAPFGSDPVFVQSSSLFNPALKTTDFYTSAELNALGVPYGFFSSRDDPFTFTVWVDINDDEGKANATLTYLQDGFFIDSNTRQVKVEIVSYNSQLKLFSSITTAFDFTSSGGIRVSSRIDTVGVEAYSTPVQYFRAFLEFVFLVNWGMSVRLEIIDAKRAHAQGLLADFIFSGRSFIDLLNFGFAAAVMLFWLSMVHGYLETFETPLRFEVYEDLKAQARFFNLANGGAGLSAARNMFGRIQYANQLNSFYAMLNGLTIIFMLARIIRLCDFQPRLGIITATFASASTDLGHYVIVLSLLFLGCTVLSNLVFGPVLETFSTIDRALVSNFNMLFMQDSNYLDSFYNLPAPLNYPGMLYYVLYCMLMTVSMVNIALAILLDAFAAVKAKAIQSQSLPQDVYSLMKYFIWSRAIVDGEHGLRSEDLLAKRVHRLQKMLPFTQKAAEGKNDPSQRAGSFAVDGSIRGEMSAGAGGLPGSTSGLLTTFKGAMSRSSRVSAAGGAGTSTMSKSFIGALHAVAFATFTRRKALVFSTAEGREHKLREDDLLKMLKADVDRAVSGLPTGACAKEIGNEDPTAVLVRSLLMACGEDEWVDQTGNVVADPLLASKAGKKGYQGSSGAVKTASAGAAQDGDFATTVLLELAAITKNMTRMESTVGERLGRIERAVHSHAQAILDGQPPAKPKVYFNEQASAEGGDIY